MQKKSIESYKDKLMSKKKLKAKTREKGITLIALVITIIVLLILAGITINSVIGSKGILNNAKKATTAYTNAEAKEKAALILQEYEIQKAAAEAEGKTPESEEDFLKRKKDNGDIDGYKTNGDGTPSEITIGGNKVPIIDGKPSDPQKADNGSNPGSTGGGSNPGSTQQLGIADAISKGIKVGDTVTYTPPTASYTVAKENSAYSSDQTFTTDSSMTTWKVWKIDTTNNTIEIVSASATGTKLHLTGATGYNQGPGIMNNICLALYSDSGKGITARSLDGQDIEEAMAENLETTRGSDYGTTYTPSNNYVPNCYTEADIQSAQNNDLRPGSSSATGSTQISGFTCKGIYYNVSLSDAVGSLRATILGIRDSWLASRCVDAYSWFADFYIRRLRSGNFERQKFVQFLWR